MGTPMGTNRTQASDAFASEFLELLDPVPGLDALKEPISAEEVADAVSSVRSAGACIGVPLDAFQEYEVQLSLAEALNGMSATVGGMRGISDAEATLIPKGGGFTFDPLELRIIEVTAALLGENH